MGVMELATPQASERGTNTNGVLRCYEPKAI